MKNTKTKERKRIIMMKIRRIRRREETGMKRDDRRPFHSGEESGYPGVETAERKIMPEGEKERFIRPCPEPVEEFPPLPPHRPHHGPAHRDGINHGISGRDRHFTGRGGRFPAPPISPIPPAPAHHGRIPAPPAHHSLLQLKYDSSYEEMFGPQAELVFRLMEDAPAERKLEFAMITGMPVTFRKDLFYREEPVRFSSPLLTEEGTEAIADCSGLPEETVREILENAPYEAAAIALAIAYAVSGAACAASEPVRMKNPEEEGGGTQEKKADETHPVYKTEKIAEEAEEERNAEGPGKESFEEGLTRRREDEHTVEL